jgi:hypothetical protein
MYVVLFNKDTGGLVQAQCYSTEMEKDSVVQSFEHDALQYDFRTEISTANENEYKALNSIISS